MELTELYDDVVRQLADERRQLVETTVEEYGASATFRFLLAVIAGATPRERQVIRVLLRQLDQYEREAAAGEQPE